MKKKRGHIVAGVLALIDLAAFFVAASLNGTEYYADYETYVYIDLDWLIGPLGMLFSILFIVWLVLLIVNTRRPIQPAANRVDELTRRADYLRRQLDASGFHIDRILRVKVVWQAPLREQTVMLDLFHGQLAFALFEEKRLNAVTRIVRFSDILACELLDNPPTYNPNAYTYTQTRNSAVRLTVADPVTPVLKIDFADDYFAARELANVLAPAAGAKTGA